MIIWRWSSFLLKQCVKTMDRTCISRWLSPKDVTPRSSYPITCDLFLWNYIKYSLYIVYHLTMQRRLLNYLIAEEDFRYNIYHFQCNIKTDKLSTKIWCSFHRCREISWGSLLASSQRLIQSTGPCWCECGRSILSCGCVLRQPW